MMCIFPFTRIIAVAPSPGKVLAVALGPCTRLNTLSDDYVMVAQTSGSSMFTQDQDEDDESEQELACGLEANTE